MLALASLGYLGYQILDRVRLWKQGRPMGEVREGLQYWIPTKDALSKWTKNLWVYVIGQKKVRSSRQTSGAPMHLAIFYGFLAMLVATTLLAINTYSPYKFHKGNYYLTYESLFDSLGLLLLFGLVWAFIRRVVESKKGEILTQEFADKHADSAAQQQKDNRRYPISHSRWDLAVLGLLILITVNGYWLEAARIASNPQPWDQCSWVGYYLAGFLGKVGDVSYKAAWWFHIVLVLGFFCIIPKLRIRHILMAVFTTASTPDSVMGKLRTISMEEVEKTEQVGVKLTADLSRWNLMSMDACMECGRCTEVCPAWNVGKVLNPKQVVQDTRTAMSSGVELAGLISEEALWQCTTCNACVEACPVNIKHVDLIVDVRRNLVSEGALSGSAATMLRQTASTNNAWGVRGGREDWMKGMDIPLCRSKPDFEYLFWVGCAGSTDPGAVKTTKAVAELLTKAGIKFACLGDEEACTGDPARRIGEEFMFQEKAAHNASIFEKYGVKKVLTACPHCFNSLKNEYGDFGAKMEVYHHTQVLQQLVSKGQLLAAKPPSKEVVYHDPCYLGRINEEVEAPRALAQGMTDPENSGVKTRCCGAGGGRMWMDEPADERPSNRRAEELLAGGATTVALGCPFCKIMLDASIKQVRPNEEIKLLDLAEMMQEANK